VSVVAKFAVGRCGSRRSDGSRAPPRQRLYKSRFPRLTVCPAKIPTLDREGAIERFQGGAAPIFLISLKAGGVGLTLTAADTVILYDPWWNPAVERQAMNRAHRIGQTKSVFVYRLVAEGTVEEAILALQARRQALADALFEGKAGDRLALDDATLTELFRPIDGAV